MNVGELKNELAKFDDAQRVVVDGDTCYEDGFIEIKTLETITVSPTPSSQRSSWMGEYCESKNPFIVVCLLKL